MQSRKTAKNRHFHLFFNFQWPYLENKIKYQKNGSRSSGYMSCYHSEPISAIFHALSQILSKMHEMVENRKKTGIAKIQYFSTFSYA